MADLRRIIEEIDTFREERDWAQFHNPKDLAISISLEAAELLEAFQWSGADVSAAGREEKIEEELADVLIYCLYMAEAIGADPLEIVERKVAVNRGKYPAEAARGTARKYTEL
jgi:NTP pyrophosphatase (non-canonical NTP hydrolase)